MAEFLIRVKDRGDIRLFRLGDVISWGDNGWDWSPRELTNPHWRILIVEGLTTDQIDSLMGRAISADPNIEPIGRRAAYVDINALTIGAPLRAYLDDDTRVAPKYTLSKAEVISLVRSHPIENEI